MKNCSISPSRDVGRCKELVKDKHGGREAGNSVHCSLIGKESSGEN